jgi:PKD repeat protein
MIKRILPLLIFCFVSKFSFSQCAIEPWSLQKRIELSSTVVEGKVIDQYPFRENGKNAIYTASVIEVYKVFKGQVSSPYLIEVITFGGQIGFEKHHADPELELSKDEVGIFLLTDNAVDVPDFVKTNGKSKYQGSASIQSFISYDLDENRAYDISENYNGITTILYETLQTLTKKAFTPVKSFGYNPERLKYRPTAGPVITGFGSSSANAGTGDLITVNGQGFGNVRGNGRIEFLDANFGDGRRMKTPYAADYKVWNDTQIKVRIPTRAGSGKIKVATNDSSSYTSTADFKINFAHLNATFTPSGGSEQYYIIDHYNDNNKGGYSFQLNTRFKANTNMVNAFLRSLETWRCGTLINWDLGRDTTIKVTGGDGVNIVRLTKYTDSRLAVCYSYWQGCYVSGTNMEWFVSEMDIEADSTRNWYYGTGTPGGSQYDFQSVLSHELGHGHQLGHVIASSEMMHYSIANGQRKATLSTNDLSGGNYVKDKSIKINVCTGGAMKALVQSACGYTKPLSGFKSDKIAACPSVNITLTDTSIGVVKSYLWNFGKDATPATATTKGPHNVTYSSEGLKTVKLFATNDFGVDSTVKKDYITVLPGKPSAPKNLVYSDTACLALATLQVDSPGGANTVLWQLPSEATVISSTLNTKRVSWTTTGGPFKFWVKTANQCGTSDSIVGSVIVLNNPTSSFTAAENGRTVTFTNASQFATSYKWTFGDGDSSQLISPVHIYPVGKAYTATLKAINKCKIASSNKTVNPFHPAGVTTEEFINKLIYPNPTHDIITISNEIVSYTLTDAMGKFILVGNAKTLDLTNMAKGVYILTAHIYTGKSIYIKLVKD